MMKDVSAAHRSMPFWNEHQKGLEALASTVGSSRSIDAEAKKALTVGDLLVKVRYGPVIEIPEALITGSLYNAFASTLFCSQSF